MTKTKTTKFKDSYPLSYIVSTMYDKRVFDVVALRRKFSHLLSINHKKDSFGCPANAFSIESRTTKQYVGIKYEYTLNADVRCDVTHSTLHGHRLHFSFTVSNNKELLQKLIHYNLIS